MGCCQSFFENQIITANISAEHRTQEELQEYIDFVILRLAVAIKNDKKYSPRIRFIIPTYELTTGKMIYDPFAVIPNIINYL
jgi:hypothetical protein